MDRPADTAKDKDRETPRRIPERTAGTMTRNALKEDRTATEGTTTGVTARETDRLGADSQIAPVIDARRWGILRGIALKIPETPVSSAE